MTSPSPSFLEDNRNLQMLLFGGKGGVGKTTCATAIALQLARCSPKRSLLLVSTDPAHSLQDSLADLTPLPNLTVLELDAQQCLDTFREKNASILEQIASAGTFLDDEDIHRVLTLSLPGADELMAFLEVSAWVESAKYDCIVVDTAPSGHTLRLLEMPAVIRKWLGVLDAFLAKRRYMRKVFARTEVPQCALFVCFPLERFGPTDGVASSRLGEVQVHSGDDSRCACRGRNRQAAAPASRCQGPCVGCHSESTVSGRPLPPMLLYRRI